MGECDRVAGIKGLNAVVVSWVISLWVCHHNRAGGFYQETSRSSSSYKDSRKTNLLEQTGHMVSLAVRLQSCSWRLMDAPTLPKPSHLRCPFISAQLIRWNDYSTRVTICSNILSHQWSWNKIISLVKKQAKQTSKNKVKYCSTELPGIYWFMLASIPVNFLPAFSFIHTLKRFCCHYF